MNIWADAAAAARSGGGALATVARTAGSTPVPVGTKLLVAAGGRLSGTVGGGCVEAEVLQAAAHVAGAGQPLVTTHHLNADLAGDIGLSCGGTVDIVIEPLVTDPAYLAALDGAAAAEAGLVSTGLEWSNGPVKWFSGEIGEGADAELADDRGLLIERIRLAPRVIVFGAGHVGVAMAAAAAAAGFRVVVVDDRPEFADPARFPPEVRVLVAGLDAGMAGFSLGPSDAVVIATRGHRHDAVLVEAAAPSSAGYVGLLGSRRKGLIVTKALVAAGVPAEALARVQVPVGLDIGAETPGEIAVSVVAQLVAWRRGRRL